MSLTPGLTRLLRAGAFIAMLGLAGLPQGCVPDAGGPGSRDHFVGDLKLSPLGTGEMTLLEDYAYVDSVGKQWQAVRGDTTDGASIPRIFWSVIGHPYGGPYLNAAVIHDRYCKAWYRTTETWRQVHRMFYVASLRAGVDQRSAKVLYGAVYHFGPHWPDPGGPAPDAAEPIVYSKAVVRAFRATESWRIRRPQWHLDADRSPVLRYDAKERALLLVSPSGISLQSITPREQAEQVALQAELLDQLAAWVRAENPDLEAIEHWGDQ